MFAYDLMCLMGTNVTSPLSLYYTISIPTYTKKAIKG